MKSEVKQLLKFISDNGPVTKENLDRSSIRYDGREDNNSNKWASDSKILNLLNLKYIEGIGGRAYPTYRVTPNGEVYLQGEENTEKNVRWVVIIGVASIISGLIGYFIKK